MVERGDRSGDLQRIGPLLEIRVEAALLDGEPPPAECFTRYLARDGDGSDPISGAATNVLAWAAVAGHRPELDLTGVPAPFAAMIGHDWRGAADAFAAIGWQYEQALMLSLLDNVDQLEHALELARGLDAAPLASRIRRRMRSLGIVVPRGPRVATRSNPRASPIVSSRSSCSSQTV